MPASSVAPAVAPSAPMTPVMYRVVARRADLDDTATLQLEPAGDAIGTPEPGQFNMLWAFGIGEAPISLAGHDGAVLHHTIRRVGKVSAALFDAQPGDMLGVRGPFGRGWQLAAHAGRDIMIVAGGLGLAPLRPAILELIENRQDFGRAVVLVGARTPDALLYTGEIEAWRSRLDLEVVVTVDTAPPSWRGDVGVVTRLMSRAPIDPSAAAALVCGPEPMMRFVAQTALDMGVSAADIWISLERNMVCAIGHCGHCQLGPAFICRNGPVMSWAEIGPQVRIRER